MRRVFASQRRNREGVAELLRDAGIEILVSNGRGYKTRRRGQFSYPTSRTRKPSRRSGWYMPTTSPSAADPARCRVLDTTRPVQGDSSAATMGFRASIGDDAQARQQRMAWRIRIVLFVLLAAGMAFVVIRARQMSHAAPAASPVPATPARDDGKSASASPPRHRRHPGPASPRTPSLPAEVCAAQAWRMGFPGAAKTRPATCAGLVRHRSGSLQSGLVRGDRRHRRH
jgi:hypothetical protein